MGLHGHTPRQKKVIRKARVKKAKKKTGNKK